MLSLGLPSKGRIQDQAFAFLEKIGLPVSRDNGRSYTARIKGTNDIRLWLLPSGEIANRLIDGRLHAGITGQDLLQEHGGDNSPVHAIGELGFARADLVVAVPRSWIDVARTSDLLDVFADIRERERRSTLVATKYVNITRRAFGSWGLKDYRIVADPGATEAAPSRGIADLIVDITTSGETLRANGLKPLPEPIMRSQAVLAASLSKTIWTDASLGVLEALSTRLASHDDKRVEVQFEAAGDRSGLDATLNETGGELLTAKRDSDTVRLFVEPDRAFELGRAVKPFAIGPVRVIQPELIIDRESAGFSAFKQMIGSQAETGPKEE